MLEAGENNWLKPDIHKRPVVTVEPILFLSITHLFLNSTEKLEHGYVGGGLGHAQSNTDALQLHEDWAAL